MTLPFSYFKITTTFFYVIEMFFCPTHMFDGSKIELSIKCDGCEH
jgi:hypothetical protein